MASSAESRETAIQDVISRLLEKKEKSHQIDSFVPVRGDAAKIQGRKEVFGAAIAEFKARTGLPCAIVKWDQGDAAEWWCSPGKDVSDFCYIVRNLGNRPYTDCLECDMCVAKHAKDTQSPLLHRCHCGISEMAIPIMAGESADYVFITGQMQPVGGFASEHNKPLLVTDSVSTHLAGRAAGLGKGTPDGSAPEETERYLEPARHALRQRAHQMTTFDRSIVVKIAAFLKYYLLPLLEGERKQLHPKGGEEKAHTVNWHALNAVTTARLELGDCTEVLEARTHQKYFPNHKRGQEVTLNMDGYMGLTYLKRNELISLTSRGTATTVPRNILTVLDAIKGQETSSFYNAYVDGPNGKKHTAGSQDTLFTFVVYEWMQRAHPYWVTDFYRNCSPVGRAPRADCANGVLQTVELKAKVEETVLSEVSHAWAQKTYDGITKKLSECDGSSMVQKLRAELESAHAGRQLKGIDLYDRLASLTQCRRPDENVVAMTGLLQEMCGCQEEAERARVFQAFQESASVGLGIGSGKV